MKHTLLFLFLLIIAPSFAQYKNKSVGFTENKGQIIDQKEKANPAVKFLLNSNGLNVQLRKNGFSYDIYEIKKTTALPLQTSKKTTNQSPQKEIIEPEYNFEYVFHRVDIDFLNSNSNVEFIKEQESKDFDNYYNIPNKPEGVLGVHSFKQITYKNIYPNIDVVFTIPADAAKTVEYNFIVHPKGKISDIQLKFNGAKTELIDNKIRMHVRFGEMDETLPASWTEDKTGKKDIAIGYKKIKNNVYGFEADIQFLNKTLIIDPIPVRLWGTYYGGNNGDYSLDLCNDSNNNVYFSGYTSSTTNIATTGTFPTPYYYTNGYIAKFDSNGVRLWGIYYSTKPSTIKVDTNQNVYFTGAASGETNVSTPASHQPLRSGYYDNAYLVKLNSSGVREWGTYYGGTRSDQGRDISFDSLNNVYLVGSAQSLENIATATAFQPTHGPGYLDNDGFIAKFNPQGTRIWGTYYGGSDGDQITSSNISEDGFLYITGTSNSTNNIATPNSYQPSLIGYGAGLIAKFTLDGERIWGSYFNGERFASITKSELKNNFLYLIGKTDSKNNLISSGTFNETFQRSSFSLGSNFNNFIVKFDLNTQSQIWGTYFGEIIQDLAVNSKNKIIIEGCTDFDSGIATAGAYSTVRQYGDAYMIKLDENGQREWGTYYGGNLSEGYNGAADVNNKISIDKLDNIYLVGNTESTSGISTAGSHQENYSLNSLGGLYNVYLAKFQDCLTNPIASSNSPICIGNELKLTASGGTNYLWTGPNGFTSTEQNPIILNAAALNSGEYSCTITGTGGCDDTKKIDVVVGDLVAPIPNLANLPNITGDCTTTVNTIPTATDACAGAITATTTSPLSYNLPGTYTVVWNYNDGNGNTTTQSQTVKINTQPLPTAVSPQIFCIQQNATLSAVVISGQNIKWYDSQTNGTLLLNTTILQNSTTYYASQTINSCESERVPILINIVNTAAPTGNSPQTFCSSQNPTLATIILTGTAIRWYDKATNGLLLPTTTPLQNGITYYASQTENGCESTTRLAVKIELINTLPARNYEELLCDDLNDGTETVNLNNYKSNIISSNPTYTLSYYSTKASAENELSANEITNTSSYRLNLGANIIYVRINSNTPCYAVSELKLTVVAKPIIPIADIVPICANNTITINAGATTNSFLWSTGETTPSITIANPGEYVVTVTRNYGPISCSSSKKFSVKKSIIATITSIETLDWTDKNNVISIYVSGTGDYEFSIDGMHYQSNNQFQNLFSGAYTVYVRDKNGCGIVTDKVYLLMYPKFFTPNGDGYNDTWNIHFSDTEIGLTVKLFDRYGKLITVLNQNQTWDGTLNGHELPSTDYWFIVTRADGKEYKGHFTLKR